MRWFLKCFTAGNPSEKMQDDYATRVSCSSSQKHSMTYCFLDKSTYSAVSTEAKTGALFLEMIHCFPRRFAYQRCTSVHAIHVCDLLFCVKDDCQSDRRECTSTFPERRRLGNVVCSTTELEFGVKPCMHDLKIYAFRHSSDPDDSSNQNASQNSFVLVAVLTPQNSGVLREHFR
jgi:hypothetical protein